MGSSAQLANSHRSPVWTPSARRCRASRRRPRVSTPPSPASRTPPRSSPPGRIRLTATSETMAKRSNNWRSGSTRPTTNSRRPPSRWRRRRRPSRRWRATCPLSPAASCSWRRRPKKSEGTLADTVTKLALSSKDADSILKEVKVVESKCMNNEVVIEDLDKNLRSTAKMASDNEQKLDELTRKLGVQENELKRGVERAELAEKNPKTVENELESVGENMKTLEKSSEKALQREEKLIDKILQPYL